MAHGCPFSFLRMIAPPWSVIPSEACLRQAGEGPACPTALAKRRRPFDSSRFAGLAQGRPVRQAQGKRAGARGCVGGYTYAKIQPQ